MTQKLALSKETLRVLDADQPAGVQGAGYPTRYGSCVTAEARTQCACQILTYQVGCSLAEK